MKSINEKVLISSYEKPSVSVSEFSAEQGYASSSTYGFKMKMTSETLN